MRFVQDELGRSVFGSDCTYQADSVVEGKATMERDRSARQQRLAAQSLSLVLQPQHASSAVGMYGDVWIWRRIRMAPSRTLIR